MTTSARTRTSAAVVVLALAAGTAAAQGGTVSHELAQKVIQLQQAEIEGVARSVVERPAAQMQQEAAAAMRQVPADKRDTMSKAIDAEVRKYLAESYPPVRERALRIAPTTIGATLEDKFSEDELRQIVAWLESPVKRKFEQVGPEARDAFIKQLLVESQPVVDPKLTALDAKIRVILGLAPLAGGTAAPIVPAPPSRAASS